jgi:hypothetical protein
MIAAVGAVALIGVAAGGYFMTRPAASTPSGTTQSPPSSTPSQTQQPQIVVPQPNAPSNAARTQSSPPVQKLAAADPKPAEKIPAKKTTPPASSPAASAAPPAAGPTAPAANPPSARANVAVSISGGYEFEVWDGSRMISPASKSHELPPQVNGKTLRLVSNEVFLNHSFKVDGGSDNRFEYAAPGLGMIEIRASRGECKAMIGKTDLGFGPWRQIPAAAGDYRVDLVCPDGQNPLNNITVTQGRTARAIFTNK